MANQKCNNCQKDFPNKELYQLVNDKEKGVFCSDCLKKVEKKCVRCQKIITNPKHDSGYFREDDKVAEYSAHCSADCSNQDREEGNEKADENQAKDFEKAGKEQEAKILRKCAELRKLKTKLTNTTDPTTKAELEQKIHNLTNQIKDLEKHRRENNFFQPNSPTKNYHGSLIILVIILLVIGIVLIVVMVKMRKKKNLK